MRARCFEKHCVSTRCKGVCQSVFLKNTKGSQHNPTRPPVSATCHSISQGGGYFVPEFGKVTVLCVCMHVPVWLLCSCLRVLFPSSGSFPFAAPSATSMAAGAWVSVWTARCLSCYFFLLIPSTSRSFALSLSFFFFLLVTPSSATPFWTCSSVGKLCIILMIRTKGEQN